MERGEEERGSHFRGMARQDRVAEMTLPVFPIIRHDFLPILSAIGTDIIDPRANPMNLNGNES